MYATGLQAIEIQEQRELDAARRKIERCREAIGIFQAEVWRLFVERHIDQNNPKKPKALDEFLQTDSDFSKIKM